MKNIVNKAFILSVLCVGTLFPMEKNLAEKTSNSTELMKNLKERKYLNYDKIKKVAIKITSLQMKFQVPGVQEIKCYRGRNFWIVPNPYREDLVKNAEYIAVKPKTYEFIYLVNKDFRNKDNWNS